MSAHPFRKTGDGGVAAGTPDLWCTYAALRTLAWLKAEPEPEHTQRTASYLAARQNSDGGFAWSRGMASDAWATFYATQAHLDLGRSIPRPERIRHWLASTWAGHAYAMLPGQRPDVWATHFSTRTAHDVCGERPPDLGKIRHWLGTLQTSGGGLSWTPEHALDGRADVRASFYGVAAWRALNDGEHEAPWDVPRLVTWLRAQQRPSGGFRLNEAAEHPCLWATYRATAALARLGEGPLAPAGCVAWVRARRGATGAFVRWEGYDVEDVWAAFCAVGSLIALDAGAALEEVREPVLRAIGGMACQQGGYTYRTPAKAADVLTTSAHALMRRVLDAARREQLRWIEGCLMPNEAGIMYMPGRGAEVRCTLWALAAGAFREDPATRGRIRHWLRELENPDGGYGYWEGRGSDMISTTAAVECLALLAAEQSCSKALEFVASCSRLEGGHAWYANVPGGEVSCRSTLQAYRIRRHHGDAQPEAVAFTLDRHRTPGGGYANVGSRLPDLLSTYEAVMTAGRFGISLDLEPLRTFLDRITRDDAVAWSPLSAPSGDALARCLATLLRRWAEGGVRGLPALGLS
jgi:prenyltransferase beta subunit